MPDTAEPAVTFQSKFTHHTITEFIIHKFNYSCRGSLTEILKEEVYEVDTDPDRIEDHRTTRDTVTKQGYLLKGADTTSDRMFVHIGSKSFKRRYCYLRQEVDGTYILEIHKDEKQCDAKTTIVMDFCTEVIQNPKKGRYCFELRMTEGGHKSVTLAAEDEVEMEDWMKKLTSILQQNKLQEDKRAASLERAPPPPSPSAAVFGTLKGLEQSLNPQLMKYGRETDMSIAEARRQSRKRLFGTIHGQFTKTPLEMKVEPYKEVFGHRILIKCECLKFRLLAPIDDSEKLCQIEPYITSFSLFDLKAGRKMSENFYFDLNEDHVKDMWQCNNNLNLPTGCCSPKSPKSKAANGKKSDSNGNDKEWIMYPRHAILNVSVPHPDIFIVVRIEKVLQGGINPSTEPYLKATKDPKIATKTSKLIKQYSQKVGHYRMPFAWAARPLFRLYSNDLDTDGDFPGIYRQDCNKLKDDEILKILNDYRKPEKMKMTLIPGTLKIVVNAISTELPKSKTSRRKMNDLLTISSSQIALQQLWNQ